jgi:phenylalanyl-tRNA synthetase alpha chain
LTDPNQGRHAINSLAIRLTSAIARWSELPADIVRRSPVVPIADNYDRLFYEPDAIARSARYSHYIDDMRMLRTHTTAAIPSLLAETERDRLMVCPGIVYRRDVVDRLHVGEPHQADFWIARRARLRRADLLKMIAVVVETIVPGYAYRCNETMHPYTMNGLEVEVRVGDRWIEVLECGEIHPWLLNESNLPCQQWSGLAMGIGLDRLVMLIKQVDDIRLLRSSDPRVARQMLTLEPYEPVSSQPATQRDMSICVADPDMELLGDRIREALGERGGWVEEVQLIQACDYASMPEAARRRLGMSPDQTNLLIRVTLRSLDGSISREDANRVYDLVYAKLHEGTAGYFRTAHAPEPP